MPKKAGRKSNKQKEQQAIQQTVDTASRIVQIVALVALVAIMIVDYYTPNTSVEVWIKGGLLAVGIGLSPKQILEFIRGHSDDKS